MTHTTGTASRMAGRDAARRGRRWRRARACLTCLAAPATLALAACDGPGVVSPGRVTVATTGGASSAQAVVGNWRRIVYFIDDFGFSRSTETTWQFGADGSVARVQVARNYTFGLVDVLVSAGRYRLEGTRVVIDLATPTPTQLTYEVRRTGNQLELAGQLYFLVTG